MQAGQAVLVDIRSDAEREWVGFVPGAAAVAWKQWPCMVMNPAFDAGLQAAVPSGMKAVLLCRSGVRLHAGAAHLDAGPAPPSACACAGGLRGAGQRRPMGSAPTQTRLPVSGACAVPRGIGKSNGIFSCPPGRTHPHWVVHRGVLWGGVLAWPAAHCAAATPPPDLKTASTSGKPARFVAPHRARPESGAASPRSPGDRAAITPPAEELRAPAPGAVPGPAAPGA